MLSIDEMVTHYTLEVHTRNRAVVDIRDKTTKELQFIKIRHRLANFYAMSLVNPRTFDVWAETQVKSASTRLKPITLQGYKDSVLLKDTSIFGFEWTFEWEDQKYKWIRESPIRSTLECKAITRGRSNGICVARYLPHGVKHEYFGLITLLDNALVQVKDERTMKLLLITSLMTILDKTNDTRWKKEKSSGALFLEPNEIPNIHHLHTYDGAKNRYEDVVVGGTDSDDDDDDYDSVNSNNDSNHNNGKQSQDLVRRKNAVSNEHQKYTAANPSPQQQSTGNGDDQDDDFAIQQQIPKGGGHSHAHDLRSHQCQQVEYISHMLSTMKHSENATVTLPSSFVQHTTIDTTSTSWNNDNFGDGRRSLQTLWQQSNYENTDIKTQHRYNNRKELEALGSSSSTPSSRRGKSQHHRTRSYRRLTSLDPPHWMPLIRQRIPPAVPPSASAPLPAPSSRHSIDLHHHSIPGPQQRYHLP